MISQTLILKAVGVDQCDSVVIATGNNLESSVLAVMHCKKLGVPIIIAKAKNATYEEVLYGIGATKVITPERDSLVAPLFLICYAVTLKTLSTLRII